MVWMLKLCQDRKLMVPVANFVISYCVCCFPVEKSFPVCGKGNYMTTGSWQYHYSNKSEDAIPFSKIDLRGYYIA
jgi:hypothetical protein